MNNTAERLQDENNNEPHIHDDLTDQQDADHRFKILVENNGLHEEEVSEIFMDIYGDDRFDVESGCCNQEYDRNTKCSLKKLCNTCSTRRKQFCKNYHLAVNDGSFKKFKSNLKSKSKIEEFTNRWREIVQKKFEKSNYAWLIDDIIKYSAYDVEIMLRNKYEKVYIKETNSQHNEWKDWLKEKSITIKTRKYFLNTNYWDFLIYKIIEKKADELSKKIENTVLDSSTVCYNNLDFNESLEKSFRNLNIN